MKKKISKEQNFMQWNSINWELFFIRFLQIPHSQRCHKYPVRWGGGGTLGYDMSTVAYGLATLQYPVLEGLRVG